MKQAAMISLAMAIALGGACSRKGSSMESVGDSVTPQSVGAIHLSETSLFPEKYRTAVEKVAKSVGRPEEFFASIEGKKGTGELVFHLWHQDAFKPENRNVVGNPGGQCRDVYFDVEKGEVTKTLWWQ
jgi:hypothetical protein